VFSQASKLLDIAKAKEKNKNNNTKTKIISIVSGKGGVGKTTVAANLSFTLSKLNKKVCLIDGDFGLPNLHLHFNVRPKISIYDYIQSTKSIDDIKINIDNNLDLLPGKSGIEAVENLSIFVFIQMLDILKSNNQYDYIVIDCGAGMSEKIQEILKISDSLIGVTIREPSALTDIYAFMKLSYRFLDQINLIFNQTNNMGHAVEITKQLDSLVAKNTDNNNFVLNILGIISYDESILNSIRLKKLPTKEFLNTTITKEFNILAKKIIKG
jgi:flagellar biosynthesis protein FlhG